MKYRSVLVSVLQSVRFSLYTITLNEIEIVKSWVVFYARVRAPTGGLFSKL